MKKITQYIIERLQLNKDRVQKIEYKYHPKTKTELNDIINTIQKHSNDNIIDLNMIDTSQIDDMSSLFYGIKANYDISKWDVSNVKDMHNMFAYSKFNNDISQWNVSKVKTMDGMFAYSEFNQDISQWDVSNVTTMSCMFEKTSFNQDISRWNVSNVTNMNGMFRFDSEFNQYLGDWDMSNVLNTCGMFNACYKFIGDGIKQWDMSNVENMSYMFKNAEEFNEDISTWKLYKYVKMRHIFFSSDDIVLKFNHDLTPWVKQIKSEEIQYIQDYIK